MKKRFAITLIISVVFLLVANYCVYWHRYLNEPVSDHDIHFVMQKNGSIASLAIALKQDAHLSHPVYFELYARAMGDVKRLRYGEYEFPAGSNLKQILYRVTHGKIAYHAFTLVDGWNIYDVMMALDRSPALSHKLTGLSPTMVAEAMRIPYRTPEGMLYPETYYYTLGTSDLTLLTRAYTKMQSHLATLWSKRQPGLAYNNTYQALIVASMVEKEASKSNELPKVAGVILNRLKVHMPLQIDSTVIYGLQPGFDGHLTRPDLRFNTPFNSYVHYGLPPTPISMPGLDAISAVLHPAKTKAMYFVAKGDGYHQFSTSLAISEKR